MTDPVNPPHYKTHPSGVETIELCRWLSFNVGNALKYVWRAGQKGSRRQDLEKSLWYVNDERERFTQYAGTAPGVPHDFAERARHVINSDPKSLLATMVALLALPPRIELEHLDGARWHLEQAIAEIKVHMISIQTGRLDNQPWQSACGLQEENQERTNDLILVTCEECRRLA